MSLATLVHVPLLACGVLGLVSLARRGRAAWRDPAQWLAVAGFGAWSLRAGIDVGWLWLTYAGVPADFRHLAAAWLRAAGVLAVVLLFTTFGIRERWRPAFAFGAIGAGALAWWLPGHGAILGPNPAPSWREWCGQGLYLAYFAMVWGALLDVGRARYRVGLSLPKRLQLRLLHAMSVAALVHVVGEGVAVLGVQAGLAGFTPEAAMLGLALLRLAFAALFWLALAPPDAWLRWAAQIEATEIRAFAATFALQTKLDAAAGYDLGWRTTLIALSEQVARGLGAGFEEVAHVRLAAALLHTELAVRTMTDLEDDRDSETDRGPGTAEQRSVHSLVARTVWVPTDVLVVLREANWSAPTHRGARVLKVVDRFLRLAQASDLGDLSHDRSSRALAVLAAEYPTWPEFDALRRVVEGWGGR